MLTFTMPLGLIHGAVPVSVNEAYANRWRGGRKLTVAAVAWKSAVHAAAFEAWAYTPRADQRALLAAADWQMRLVYRLHKTASRRDTSNLVKLAEDSVAKALGVDDSRIAEVGCRREYVALGERETLTVQVWIDGAAAPVQEGVSDGPDH